MTFNTVYHMALNQVIGETILSLASASDRNCSLCESINLWVSVKVSVLLPLCFVQEITDHRDRWIVACITVGIRKNRLYNLRNYIKKG